MVAGKGVKGERSESRRNHVVTGAQRRPDRRQPLLDQPGQAEDPTRQGRKLIMEHQVEVRTRFSTLREAAVYLNVTERFIRRVVSQRKVRFYKIGELLRFDAVDLDAPRRGAVRQDLRPGPRTRPGRPRPRTTRRPGQAQPAHHRLACPQP